MTVPTAPDPAPMSDQELEALHERYSGTGRALFSEPQYGATIAVADARRLLAEADRLRAALAEAEQARDEAIRVAGANAAAYDEARADYQNAIDSGADVVRDLKQARAERDALGFKLGETAQQLRVEQQTSAALKQHLVSEQERLRGHLDRFRAENTELRSARDELREAMPETYQAMNTLSERGGQYCRERDEARAALAESEARRKDLFRRLGEHMDDLGDARIEVDRLRAMKCDACAGRIGYISSQGNLFGWGCADGGACQVTAEPETDADGRVLVGDSWFAPDELPHALARFMASSAEHGREAKRNAMQVQRLRAELAEERRPDPRRAVDIAKTNRSLVRQLHEARRENTALASAVTTVATALDQIGGRIYRDLHVEATDIEQHVAAWVAKVLRDFTAYTEEQLAVLNDPAVRAALGETGGTER